MSRKTISTVLVTMLVTVGVIAVVTQISRIISSANAPVAAVATTVAANPPLLDPPYLLHPDDGIVSTNVAEVNLQWQWERPLAADEFFDVRVWTAGKPAYGITWTKDTTFDITSWLLYQKPQQFFWTIAVVQQTGSAGQGRDISVAAAPRSFTMQQINMDLMTLPTGFTDQLWIRLPFTQPTVITFGPDQAMYALAITGKIARISQQTNPSSSTVKVIYDNPNNQLDAAVGLAIRDGVFYVSDAGKVSTLKDTDGNGILDLLTPIVTGLPTREYTFHSNNGLAFGPDGKLYIAVGATTDHGPLREKYEASILRVNPDGTDLEVFATGFRNPYDLVFTPNGDLFTGDNSPDALDAMMPYLPPEELDHVIQGKDYGFPTLFPPATSPNVQPPVAELLTSSASAGITYYDAAMFPPEYHGIYLAQFGTGAPYPQGDGVKSGRDVVFVALQPDGKGSYIGTWEVFAQFRTDLGDYTPIDVIAGPDGALYVAEYYTGAVFRIIYTGDQTASAGTQGVPAASATPNAQAALGEQIFKTGLGVVPACMTCHTLDPQSVGVGPSLLNLTSRMASIAPGMTAAAFIKQMITNPNSYIAPGYKPDIMYQGFAQHLTPDQIDAVVAYVLTLSAPQP